MEPGLNLRPTANERESLGLPGMRYSDVYAKNVNADSYTNIKGQWRPGEVVETGYVRYPNNSPAYNFLLRCVRGGVTGDLEPIWPDAGKEIAEGTAIWRAEHLSKRVLTGNTTVYVDAANGNDSNDGLANTAAGALRTVGGVMAWIRNHDFNLYSVTFRFATGNYGNLILFDCPQGITIDSTTPASPAVFSHVRIISTIKVLLGTFNITGITTNDYLLLVDDNSEGRVIGTITFSGNCSSVISVSRSSLVYLISSAKFIFSNPYANYAIAEIANDGNLICPNVGAGFTGNATGKRFVVSNNSNISLWTDVNAANLIPGTVAGTVRWEDGSTFGGIENPATFVNKGDLNPAQDWNTFTTPGVYVIDGGSWGANSPRTTFPELYTYGILEVIESVGNAAGRCTLQRYTPHSSLLNDPRFKCVYRVGWNGGFSNFWVSTENLNSNGLNVQIFTASGTFIVPAGITKLKVTCIGGAGGAGGASITTINGRIIVGSKGGNGATGWVNHQFIYVSDGEQYTVTVGAGGEGRGQTKSSTLSGGSGGVSSFGTVVSASGGSGGGAYYVTSDSSDSNIYNNGTNAFSYTYQTGIYQWCSVGGAGSSGGSGSAGAVIVEW